jgi:dienelactone hydrolase
MKHFMARRLRRSRSARAGWLLLLALVCAACSAIPSPEQRRQFADELAAQQGWRGAPVQAGAFELLAYHSDRFAPAERLTIYIEGDGFAWITPSQPSSDPTPRDPLALRLALAQPEGNAAYLARPCQYADARASGCASRYWQGARFSEEVIDANDRAIDALKRQFGATRLTLVGYSGGGATALLVAARRNDVEGVVTVAGNLDHRAWTARHRLQPLADSLDPAAELDALRAIPQWHFVGGRDDNITPGLVQAFAQRFPETQRPAVRVEAQFDHRCCWVDAWPLLWTSLARPAR